MTTVQDAVAGLRTNRPWLSFVEPTLDERMRSMIAAEEALSAEWIEDELDLERNLQRAGNLIDRCFAHRREWQELASAALKYALDYEHFDHSASIQLQLETAAWNDKVRDVAASIGKVSRDEFGQAADPLAAGFAAVAAGEVERVAAAGTAEQTRRDLITRKHEADRAYRERLELLHAEPGGLLNFGERADRVLGLLEADLRDACRNLAIAQRGAERFYPGSVPAGRRASAEEHPLDALIVACRRLMRTVEEKWQGESEWEVVVSLKDGKWARPVADRTMPPIDGDVLPDPGLRIAWAKVCDQVTPAGVTSTNLTVNLRDSTGHVAGLRGPQLRGRVVAFGLSLAVKDLANRKDYRLFFADAEIYPQTPRRNVADHAVIQNVSIYQPGMPVAWTTAPAVRNVPVEGEWMIDLSALRSSYNENLAWTDVADIFLHLVIRGTPGSHYRRMAVH